MPARVSIVIPVYNRVDLTTACLVSLVDSTPDELYEVVVVDNGSSDGTPELLATLSGDVTVVTNTENRGFGEACNQGAARAQGEYLLFLNNDTVLFPGWLQPLVAALDEDARRGAVQPRLLYPDGRLNDAGGLVFADGEAWVYGKGSPWPAAPEFSCRRAVDYASGACLLVRRTAFEQVGGFDQRYAPAYYEDTDLSFSLRRSGWHLLYEPASTIVHVEGGTAGTDETSGLKAYQVRNKGRFAEKWADELALRPALDPSLVEAWAHRPQEGLVPDAGPAPSVDRPRSILVIDPFTPAFDVASGSRRLFELVRCLRAQGHAVAFYVTEHAFDRARYARALGVLGVTVYGVDSTEVEPGTAQAEAYRPELASVLLARRPDVVLVGPWTTAETVLPVVRAAAPSASVVVDSCDLHFVRERREAEVRQDGAGSAALALRHERELAVYGAADHVVCVTETEADVLRRELPDVAVSVVTNVHPEADAGPGRQDRQGLLFVGNANHAPNVDAVRWWRDEIAPRLAPRLPGVELTVVGHDPAGRLRSLQAPGLRVVGWVPDTEPYLHAALASVAPLRYGAGMKGKVGEALARGVPVVATSIAAEGMALLDGRHALLADDPDSFADAVVRVHDDAVLWGRLRAAGREHIEGLAGVESVHGQLRALLARLGRGPSAPPSRRQRRAPVRRAARPRRPGSRPMEVHVPRPPSSAVPPLVDGRPAATQGPVAASSPVRSVAFYLPQFHPVPENDAFWGPGFTEWHNVVRARPGFPGHHQPHLPADLGFYDLRTPETRIAQADLARRYGIDAFCYYHYWFGGRRVLERPLEDVRRSGSPDLPFLLCWANESWRGNWDGRSGELLLEQTYSPEDDLAHAQYLVDVWRDERYVRVDGRPVFLVYRAASLPDPLRTTAMWRRMAERAGVGDPLLCRVESGFGVEHGDPAALGFDAAVEFQPAWDHLGAPDPRHSTARVHDYAELVAGALARPLPPYRRFPGVVPRWDNTARRAQDALVLHGSTPELYASWVSSTVARSSESLLFVNAWNEWAEGAHLEPDDRYGHAYLQAHARGVQAGLHRRQHRTAPTAAWSSAGAPAPPSAQDVLQGGRRHLDP